MANKALSIVSTITQEIMAVNQIPGGAAVGHVFSAFQKRRETQARDILMKRIAEAEIDIAEAAEKDEMIGVIYAYMQAASKGAARANLDLLSQAIAGEMKRDQIYPDKFLKYVNILSTLTRDEIFIIGAYVRCRRAVLKEAEGKNEVFLRGIYQNTWNRFVAELVPKSFETDEHVKVILGGLVRTGLVKAASTTIDEIGVPSFTILLDEIAPLIDFDKAYREFPSY